MIEEEKSEMKAEKLEIFDLKGNLLGIEKRDKFYNEIKNEYRKKGKITRMVKSIRLLLMNSNGRIYVQKRSKFKEGNAGLYDKTIGGHTKAGYTWYMTVVHECHQELGFPAVVLPEDEFLTAIGATDLGIIGLFRRVDFIRNFVSVRKSKDGDFKQPYITSFYIGYYDGSIRFCDGESTGIEVFTLDELEKRIKEEPGQFTEDLKFMIKKYRKYMVPVEKLENSKKPVKGYEED